MLQSELTNNPPRKQSKKQRWECLRRSHLLLRLLFSSLPQSGCLSKITCSQTVLSSERLPCIRHFLLRVVSWDGCICRLSPETECGMVGSGRRTTPAEVALFCWHECCPSNVRSQHPGKQLADIPPRKQSERQSREVKAPLGIKKPALGIVASEPLTVTITIFFFATERLPMKNNFSADGFVLR